MYNSYAFLFFVCLNFINLRELYHNTNFTEPLSGVLNLGE